MKGSSQAFADSVFLAVKGYVDVAIVRFFKQAIEPVEKRIEQIPAGRDGRDADLDAIAESVLAKVTRALEAIPAPKDGRDGIDGKSVDMVQLSTMVVEAAVKAAQALPPAPAGKDGAPGTAGKDGADGRDGASVDPAVVAQLVASEVKSAVAQIPPAPAGKDGASASLEDVRAMLADMVAKAVAQIPVQKGDPGEPGKDGQSVSPSEVEAMVIKAVAKIPAPKDGKDGRDADPEVIRAEVKRAVDLIPKPRDGRDGQKGDPGDRGADGRDGIGERGGDGRDGRDADPELVRQEVALAIAAMPKPEPGPPGRDGINLGDIDIEAKDGGRIIVFKAKAGDKELVRELRTAMVIYRGTYKSSAPSQAGDSVTYGGSTWIAKRDTDQAPGGEDWQLAVKRGRDGKDALGAGDPT